MAAVSRAISHPLTRCGRSHLQRQSQRTLSTPRPSDGDFVRVIEVGPRDGLQNEKRAISKDVKLELIRRLAASGLRTIEAGSFVSPKWVPQMASSDEIMRTLVNTPPPTASGDVVCQWLLPNLRGLDTFESIYKPQSGASADNDHDRALYTSSDDSNAIASTDNGPSTLSPSGGSKYRHEISIFLAATESFSKSNTNCTIAESVERSKPLMARARAASIPVRAYISVALGCPFEGPVAPKIVAELAATLLELGADEISVADTTGQGTAPTTRTLLKALTSAGIRAEDLALHFHDTYGQALMNTIVGLEHGVRTFDAAVGGLGGCPFSPGATGNVATEDLVYTLHGMGAKTGVDLDKLSEVGAWISDETGRVNESRAGKAILARKSRMRK